MQRCMQHRIQPRQMLKAGPEDITKRIIKVWRGTMKFYGYEIFENKNNEISIIQSLNEKTNIIVLTPEQIKIFCEQLEKLGRE